MISIPCAVYIEHFKWQLELFWYAHKKVYGDDAYNKSHAVIINRNGPTYPDINEVNWKTDIPYTLCKSFFDYDSTLDKNDIFFRPINIQIGIKQIIQNFNDDEILEILDCDMFHMRPAPDIQLGDCEILVCDLYEKWHLKSLTDNEPVIEPYIKIKEPIVYNGGFVPIITKVKTIKLILDEWIDIHVKILNNNPDSSQFKWWAGMYSLQVACQNNNILMKQFNNCYIPTLSPEIEPTHYIAHYSVDRIFNKQKFSSVDINTFPNTLFYNLVKEWLITK